MAGDSVENVVSGRRHREASRGAQSRWDLSLGEPRKKQRYIGFSSGAAGLSGAPGIPDFVEEFSLIFQSQLKNTESACRSIFWGQFFAGRPDTLRQTEEIVLLFPRSRVEELDGRSWRV